VDALKFAGGSFSLMPRKALQELLALCHTHNVLVSTGGFIERVLTLGPEAVHRYIQECKAQGFDIIEVSSGLTGYGEPRAYGAAWRATKVCKG